VALVKNRLGLDVVQVPGAKGQFEVIVDGRTIAERGGNWLTRRFGAGYPDLEKMVERLVKGR
jgi:predicted Rdx family selenoprotein